jgi:hypothetical protein
MKVTTIINLRSFHLYNATPNGKSLFLLTCEVLPQKQNFVIYFSDGIIPAYSKKLPIHAPYFVFLTL